MHFINNRNGSNIQHNSYAVVKIIEYSRGGRSNGQQIKRYKVQSCSDTISQQTDLILQRFIADLRSPYKARLSCATSGGEGGRRNGEGHVTPLQVLDSPPGSSVLSSRPVSLVQDRKPLSASPSTSSSTSSSWSSSSSSTSSSSSSSSLPYS